MCYCPRHLALGEESESKEFRIWKKEFSVFIFTWHTIFDPLIDFAWQLMSSIPFRILKMVSDEERALKYIMDQSTRLLCRLPTWRRETTP